MVRLHDVVFSSLLSLDWWTPAGRGQLRDKLEAYLDAASAANDLSLWSAAGRFRKRLQALVAEGDLRPAFLLALLVASTPEEIDPAPLGDPAAKAAALAAAGCPVARVEFHLLIETVEQLFRRAKTQGGAAVTAFLNASLPMFDSLATLPDLNSHVFSELPRRNPRIPRKARRKTSWVTSAASAASDKMP